MLNALRKSFEPAKRADVSFASTPSEHAEGNSLFEALVCELHWTALQIGAIASSLNACLAFNQSWMLRSCSNLLPVESPVVKTALRSWRDIALAAEAASAINHIYIELSDAKRATVPLIHGAGNFVGPAISAVRLEQLALVWCKLAEFCRDAILELEPETRWRLDGDYTGNALMLGKFLKEAASGAYTCVNRRGEVALPVLPQRRRTRTFTLSRPCKVTTAEGVVVGLAIAVSTNGIDFSSDWSFRSRDSVVVEFQNGRKHKGQIACSKTGKASVSFDQPLPENDPLLAGR